MQARYYDPVIGRFYSNDPLGFRDTHSFNRYAYANNNPYKFIDPDGKDPESNYWARVLGYKNFQHANSQGPKDFAVAAKNAKADIKEGAGALSNAATLAAVTSGVFGQVHLVGSFASVAAVSGFVEASLSDNPQQAIAIEALASLSGANTIGVVADIGKKILGGSNQTQGMISAGDEAAQYFLSEAIKNGASNNSGGGFKSKPRPLLGLGFPQEKRNRNNLCKIVEQL